MPKAVTQTAPLPLPTEEIYDLLMCEIEPELCTAVIADLDRIYAEETEEERRERGERYAAAFEEFSKRFEKLISLWKEHLQTFKEKTMKELRRESRKQERAELRSLEKQFGELN